MTKWQRRARLLIALFAVGFAVALFFAFKRRVPVVAPPVAGRTDPNAVVESTRGISTKVRGAREDVNIAYEKLLTYKDGTTKLLGIKVTTKERTGSRTFVVSAKEGFLAQNESGYTLNGDVTLVASDGLTAKTEHATYLEADGIVRAPGPVEFSRKRLSGSGIGMTYDKNQDVMVILDQAHIHMNAEAGGGGTDVTSPTATIARRDKYIRFERGMRAIRGGQIIESDNALAHLSADEERVETVELRGGSKVTSAKVQPGGLQALTGRDMDLKYAPNGETLEHAVITGDGVLQVAGEKGSSGRRITATIMDISLAPDGVTPVGLIAREAVQLSFPAEQGTGARTIKAANLDAKGEAKKGLTSALFTGTNAPACADRKIAPAECDVDYRETNGNSGRAAKSASLEVSLKSGLSSIEEAKFSQNVRFEEGSMGVVAAVARYVLDKGTLELSGSDAAAPRPHVVNDQITVDAAKIDVTLAGPKMKATGSVISVLQPRKDKGKDSKTPSMLKGDQIVNITADALDYDGTLSKASYTGKARLWQADTSIQGGSLTLDNKNGDISASGDVTTSAMLEQKDTKDKKKKERIRTVGTAKDFKYEESMRRATYTTGAHLSGPQGDMVADKIELYLQPSGNEVDRAEAYAAEGKLTLSEQNRKTTGTRLTYTTTNETYVVTGRPVTILDKCGGETKGVKLTFISGTDTVTIDSGAQRTQTTSGTSSKCQASQ